MHIRNALVIAAALLATHSASATTPLSESYRLHAEGNLLGAVRAMKLAVEDSPRQYFLRVRLAYLDLLAADYGGAVENYAIAVEMNPNAVEPWLGKQQALLSLGRFDESVRAGRGALGLDSRSYLASSRLAWALLQQKHYVDAAEEYASVVLLYPGDVDMRLGLAQALLGAGRCTDATRAFEDVIAMVPGQKIALQGLAACR